MNYDQWTDDRPTKHAINTSCLGDVFAHPSYHVDFYYDADTSKAPKDRDSAYSTCISRTSKEDVLELCDLLRAAGFVFEHSMRQRALPHTGTKETRDDAAPSGISWGGGKPTEAHCFTILAGQNSPVMRRFLLNGCRWIAENWGCREAFVEICKGIDLTDRLAVFNAFIVASLADHRMGPHNVGLTSGYYKLYTQRQFDTLRAQVYQNASSMNSALATQVVKDEPLREPSADFDYLKKPGGMSIYMKKLAAAEAWNKDRKTFDGTGFLAAAMGLDALTGSSAVAL